MDSLYTDMSEAPLGTNRKEPIPERGNYAKMYLSDKFICITSSFYVFITHSPKNLIFQHDKTYLRGHQTYEYILRVLV